MFYCNVDGLHCNFEDVGVCVCWGCGGGGVMCTLSKSLVLLVHMELLTPTIMIRSEFTCHPCVLTAR